MILSVRERAVLELMAQGMTNRQIGRCLNISEDTVKTHAHRLYVRIGARDRASAVAIAFRNGWLS